MDLLLILTYAAICWTVFKVFRIPVNQWTLSTAVLGGIFLISALLLIMSYNHPYSGDGRIYFTSAPVIPVVGGQVVEVPVQPNTPLNKGDVLFRIDPRPYQFVVDQKKAALAEAKQTVLQLKSALDAANSAVSGAEASRDRSLQSFEKFQQSNENAKSSGKGAVFSELEVENRRGIYLTSEAAVETARAQAMQAKLAYDSEINGTNPTVARLQAELGNAEYDLDQTTVRAPSNGYVTQVFLRPGMMANPLPLRPVMVFINSEDRTLAAAFIQNSLQRVRVGDAAEVSFRAVPGKIFKARVQGIIDVMAQGQLQPTGALIDPQSPERASPGQTLASIEILEDTSKYQLPGGVVADVAVYTEHWHHVAVLRKVLLRMSSWMNFVFLEH
ncbi:HlyD family secretion protein [Rhizobium hidalgonense]|uniref:HlyD family secretion protein n=1 Tax=Rhizobium hidalgonense TaxID=1538159 RepID=A0A2A6KGG9_9HYPH|nr:HlyD family secretion protein [Rhizobium hidalgonense]EJC77627.1 multidrug resistance efflux pump [Rhizobium leguminosarum bv. trifolii WSM2012]MDR9773734.1 HlyD family secretion protein [Rhizobium hidalgonense]MDR9810962.1 HlyD family secretion protein [Rhizobium hidalgonense]MDR9819245.1 HlyD family secretion protein [Rhizobium hidalgonense]PDT23620.1 HlyD family secretion protein [Rhizobium hidalgonense]